MEIGEKLRVLHRIYEIYDTFVAERDIACRPGCAHCCTRNVTLTTLEGYAVIDQLAPGQRTELLDCIGSMAAVDRFRPEITINLMATLCAAGKPIPDETIDPRWGACPILTEDDAMCPIYPIRPFGCRCMVSDQACTASGYARMDPFIVTVNTVCQQMIEHIDIMGCTGNLTDILLALGNADRLEAYGRGRLLCQSLDLLPNRPLKVLMVPPEHRTAIQPILDRLSAIQTDGRIC